MYEKYTIYSTYTVPLLGKGLPMAFHSYLFVTFSSQLFMYTSNNGHFRGNNLNTMLSYHYSYVGTTEIIFTANAAIKCYKIIRTSFYCYYISQFYDLLSCFLPLPLRNKYK